MAQIIEFPINKREWKHDKSEITLTHEAKCLAERTNFLFASSQGEEEKKVKNRYLLGANALLSGCACNECQHLCYLLETDPEAAERFIAGDDL